MKNFFSKGNLVLKILLMTVSIIFIQPAGANDSKNELIGTWNFDIESSLIRCERLQSHDCATWKNLSESERNEEIEKYRKGFKHASEMVLTFSETEFTTNNNTFPYEIQKSIWSHVVIKINKKNSTEEWLVLIKETPEVLCFGEKKQVQDVMCFRRVDDNNE
jgi:hypothetical protein